MSTEALPLVGAAGPGVAPDLFEPGSGELAAGGLLARLVPVTALTEAEVEEMLRLFRAHFHVPAPDAFFRDLERKQLAIRILDEEGRLQGFSTLTSFRARHLGKEVGVVYSGDTIINPDHWGTTILPKAWLQAVMALGARLPRPLYWFLLSSGYKTYRMLPVFFREFFPRFDRETPAEVRGLVHGLARRVAGDQYDARAGIIRFHRGATPLKAGVAEPGPVRSGNPHTAFFLARNPEHMSGDELVCVAEVSDRNLSRGGRRILRALGHERLP